LLHAVKSDELNSRFVPRNGREGETRVAVPQTLDFGENISSTLDTLRDIRDAIIFSDFKSITVDLSGVHTVTDAAAVVLVAELQRCFAYARSKSISGTWPDPETQACGVLTGLKAFEFLELGGKVPTLDIKERRWFRIMSHRETRGEDINALMEHFIPFTSQYVAVDIAWKKKFYRALTDATTNTLDHAYYRASKRPWLHRRWWAAGLVDENSDTVRFVFWDQGLGIPETMRRRTASLGGVADVITTDRSMIERAVVQGSSRFRNRRRGHGLHALIELIDLAPHGTLDIISGKGRYRHMKGREPELSDLPNSIGGTLLVWTLRKKDGGDG
jgi:hypothetical protein